MLKLAGFGVAAAIALGAFAVTAQAAPANSTGDLKATVGTGSNVELAAYRRCWWRNGVRRCRYIDDDYGYYDDRYYGYGPGVNLYFGGRGHGHGHGHGRH